MNIPPISKENREFIDNLASIVMHTYASHNVMVSDGRVLADKVLDLYMQMLGNALKSSAGSAPPIIVNWGPK